MLASNTADLKLHIRNLLPFFLSPFQTMCDLYIALSHNRPISPHQLSHYFIGQWEALKMSRAIQFHRDSCSFPNEAKTLMKGFNKAAPLAQGVPISDLDVRSQPFVSQIKAVIYIRYVPLWPVRQMRAAMRQNLNAVQCRLRSPTEEPPPAGTPDGAPLGSSSLTFPKKHGSVNIL